MVNSKCKKQQHTHQINKMFYVLKKKRGVQISVCAVRTKSSEGLVSELSGLTR